uniref:Uncharacterized protein n=1 Tax=Picea sitchensis TaxID=3332 RepID=A0A6B9XVB9_PICSI|nr:hypothetical protein Q903MT_gene4228 [Picea sitchensis]
MQLIEQFIMQFISLQPKTYYMVISVPFMATLPTRWYQTP